MLYEINSTVGNERFSSPGLPHLLLKPPGLQVLEQIQESTFSTQGNVNH